VTRSGPDGGLPRGIVFSTDVLEPLLGLASRAEAAGFSRVWTTEYPHRDAVIRALAIGMNTERIGIGTGISYAFSRSALAMASMTADVQRLTDGRFALGLGPGTRGVRRWYDADFEPPAEKLIGFAEDLRTAWQRNVDLPTPPPLYASALGPVIGRRVAATFDGILLHPIAVSRAHLHERLLPAIRAGAIDRPAPHVVAWCITSVDSDEERARDRARSQLAFYFSTPSYASVAVGTSWAAVPSLVQQAFLADRKRPWSELAPLIPDDMLDDLTLAGTPSSVGARAASLSEQLADAGVSEIAFAAAGADVDADEFESSCADIVDALAPQPGAV
jgi:alkanesulfonate monooxygenase SsuD/methylene tetrahydromethanopterin reductase-like flavin-dependent oxidoreductase (luciferase family)